jgi:murein DD-endopeptidase MepM/ murein hydrolase activator NlpD
MRPNIVSFVTAAALCGITAVAAANPALTVSPKKVHAGDPVLVTVTGAKETPKGKIGGTALKFFRTRNGYQALFAVPLDAKPEPISIEVEGAPIPAAVAVEDHEFPETSLIVEDELANPDKPDRDRIDADNKAIIDAARENDEPMFVKPFRRPAGEVTSVFGEWRTFNDGHKSQHLGMDVFAKEGAPVHAINKGVVTLVRDTFLAGNVVVVSHGAGIASAYYHLSETKVAEGDNVDQNTVIGLAGHTGRTTGPHLHLSVRVPGGFVDPAAFFKLAVKPAPATARAMLKRK